MNSSLLRSEPIAIRLIIGSSRSAVMPWTYCGVTAVSSMTTPGGLGGRPAGGRADVVDRSGREPRQRRDVVEQPEQTCTHRVPVMTSKVSRRPG